jgi:outer membrane PBP1 activator LpoA protein
MTHSYEDIIRLDSERTQGQFEANYGLTNSIVIIGSGKEIATVDTANHEQDAQYIAAMPDAVGLLREYRAMLERAKKWFDMAVTYKMEVAEGGCNQYKIATINGWQAPDLPALITELQRLVGENP